VLSAARPLVATLLVGAAALAAGCGSSDKAKTGHAKAKQAGAHRYPYPAAVTKQFITSCSDQGGAIGVCHCVVERLQETLPYAKFQAADRALTRRQAVDRGARQALDAAAATCRSG
jgi:hypothetical protein